MPTKYTIRDRNSTYELHVNSGVCVTASSSIDWSVGLPFEHVRKYAEHKGWTIMPVEAEHEVTTFEFQGHHYEVEYTNNRMHITRDDDEISWHELPEQLKGLL